MPQVENKCKMNGISKLWHYRAANEIFQFEQQVINPNDKQNVTIVVRLMCLINWIVNNKNEMVGECQMPRLVCYEMPIAWVWAMGVLAFGSNFNELS